MSTKTAQVKVVVLGDVDNFKKGMNESADAAEGAGRDINESFDSLGDASGSAEQKFIGFKDTITGTQDVMEGFRTGNVITLAQGFADLAGAGEALWASFGKVTVQIGKKIAATAADTASTIANTAATIASKVATFAAEAATKAWAAAQWLLNAALSANPIALVVIGIVALIAIIVLAWQHSETFRAIVTAAFNAVLDAGKATWSWITDNFPKLLQFIIYPFTTAWSIISGVWSAIQNGSTAAKDWVVNTFNSLVNFVTGLPGQITSAASGMFDGIKSAFRSAINWIISKWNDLSFSIPAIDTHIPGIGKVGGFTLSTPNISLFEQGGFVKGGRGGVLGMVGEGAKDEVVVPLDRFNRNGGLGTTINVAVYVPPTANPVDTGRELKRVLNRYERTLVTR